MAYAKINNVATANMAKVFNVAKAGFGKIAGVDAPADAYTDNYSMLFDGTNDQVNVDDAGAVISGDLGSISMWFQQPVTASSITHLYFEADANNRLLIYHHGGRNEFTCEHKGGGTERAIIITTTVEGNGWHHFVYTWNTAADASVLYLDGSSAGTGQAADFTGTISNVSIGWRYGSGMYYQGNINDVAFFDDVLTGGEVTAIYQNGDPKDESSHSGLVGYWKFEENTGTSIADGSSNSNPATLVNGTAFAADVPTVAFADAKSLAFDQSDDYVAIDDFTFINENISVSWWCKRESTAHNLTIFNALNDPTSDTYYLGFAVQTNLDTGIKWWFGDQAGNTYWGSNSGDIGFNSGDGWHHFVMTIGAGPTTRFQGVPVVVYMDGSSVFDSSGGGSGAEVGSTAPLKLRVGSRFNGGSQANVYNGNINDVAFFNTILDADAVTVMYNSGDPTDLRVDSGNYDNSANLTGYWWFGDGDTYPTITDHSHGEDANGTMTNMTSGDIETDAP